MRKGITRILMLSTVALATLATARVALAQCGLNGFMGRSSA
jgi:hypothetical protein